MRVERSDTSIGRDEPVAHPVLGEVVQDLPYDARVVQRGPASDVKARRAEHREDGPVDHPISGGDDEHGRGATRALQGIDVQHPPE